MREIQPAEESAARLWGKGKAENTTYRLLTYVIVTEAENGALYHNVVTGELLFLDDTETKLLSTLPAKYAPWMDSLIEKRYLVKEEQNDKKTIDSLRMMWRTMCASREINSYVILPTTNCNARCFYCYENCVPHENMSDETADKLLAFMEKNHGDKKIKIEWFGGEPLLGISKIDRICDGLRARNIPFSTTMITNGYLFTKEIADRIKEDWQISDIQITLDGTEDVYNEIKAYVTPCESPFRRVLDNIEHLLDNDIVVHIRLNMGIHNADDLIKLADELAVRFYGRKRLDIYSAMLYEDCGAKPMTYTDAEHAFLHNKWFELGEHLKARFAPRTEKKPRNRRPMSHLKHISCMADWTDCVLVTPTGNLAKCEHHIHDHLIGNLTDGITEKQELPLFAKHREFPACETCVLYPECIKLEMCNAKKNCSDLHRTYRSNSLREQSKVHYKEFLCDDKNFEERRKQK